MKILLIVSPGVERSDVDFLLTELRPSAEVSVASLDGEGVDTWANNRWSSPITTDGDLRKLRAVDFDAIVIPSGELHVTKLLESDLAAQFLKSAFSQKRVIAAIRYGVALLIKTGIVQGLTVTSCESLRTFVINAGSEWSSKDIVIDHGVITVRRPGIAKLPQAILREIPEAEKCRAAIERRYGKIVEHA